MLPPRIISLNCPAIDPRTGKNDSAADPAWPAGLVVDYRFWKGEPCNDKNGFHWTGGARTIATSPDSQLGIQYAYAGGDNPFGNGVGAPEQYFAMPELNEFWFKRTIHIPANYYHRKMLRLPLVSATGWQVGDSVRGLIPTDTATIQYTNGNTISVRDAVNADIPEHWNTTITNVTRSLTSTCSAKELRAGNNKFQVFFCDAYSVNGHSPTVVFQLWPQDFPNGTWGNGSTLSLQVAVDLDNSGDQPNTNFSAVPFFDAADAGKTHDIVFYIKTATGVATYNGIAKVFLRKKGESNYVEKFSAANINLGVRPGYGAFRQGYFWGHANSGYEQATNFYELDNLLSTTPIDGITL